MERVLYFGIVFATAGMLVYWGTAHGRRCVSIPRLAITSMRIMRCKRRCKIPHYRRDKIPHPITLMHVFEGCGNANDGGILDDPRSLQSRTEHQSDRPENWV